MAIVADSSLGRAASLVVSLLRRIWVDSNARRVLEGQSDADDTSRPPEPHSDGQSLGRLAPIFSFSLRLSFEGLCISGPAVKIIAPQFGKNPLP